MIIPIGPAGSVGLVKDTQSHELPLAAWTAGLNVRFEDGKALRIAGQQEVFGVPSGAPIFAIPLRTTSADFWVYASLTKLYATDGATHEDITRAAGGDYGATLQKNWTGGQLGGILVLNNGVDAPQAWLTPGLASKVVALPDWPASTICGTLRVFKNFLIALDVTESGTRYPQMIRWSHPADPGTVPVSWDYTDPTKDSGRFEMRDSDDFFVDAASLRDVMVLYKERSVHGMQFVGGVNVFRFFKMFDDFGLLNRRCVAEFRPGQHLVVSADDVLIHDGQQAQSVLTGRWRNYLFQSRMDPMKTHLVFTAVDWIQKEVLICYSTRGSTYCDEALVWNFRENRLSLRELPQVAHIASGQISFSGVTPSTWDADSGSWDSDTTAWDFSVLTATTRRMLMCAPGATRLYGAPVGKTFAGNSFTSMLERVGLGLPLRVDQPPDYSTQKSLRRLWPRITGEPGKVINISIGRQDKIEDQPQYGQAFSYVIGKTESIDPLVTSRLHAIKFETAEDFDWQLHGYEVDIVPRGGI